MNGINELDEMLERLWQLGERGDATVRGLKDALKERYKEADLETLDRDGFVAVAGEVVRLTENGMERSRRLIRAHRIGERLIHDVLGGEFESGACEFEHILSREIVDGICTLLGHPRECPHGFPIPEGECCRMSARYARQIIVPLTELAVGQTARVAYVYTQNDQQLHKLSSLQIQPGSTVKLHQEYPSYVIECEGASIALDAEVAGSINVWIGGDTAAGNGQSKAEDKTRPSFAKPRWRWRLGKRGPR